MMNSLETLHRLPLPDGETLFYTLRRKKGMKHLYLYIKNGKVEVRCNPSVSLGTIERFLLGKSPWIRRKLRQKHPEHDPAESFPWDGRLIPLEFAQKIHRKTFRFDYDPRNNRAVLSGPMFPDSAKIRELYETHYRRHAAEILGPTVEYWSRITGLVPSRVGYRKARSRWGSCNAQNALSLNTRLLICPAEIRDYVIVHELCHIRHKNHSKDFWDLVGRYLPDWKERRKRLREYERYLYIPTKDGGNE
ncbi:M48 family metallopeptidase [Nitratifractor sp.]